MTRKKNEIVPYVDHQGERIDPIFTDTPFAYITPITLDAAKAIGLVVPRGVTLPRNAELFALRASDGATLGITDSWDSAYAAAMQNDFVLLSVH